MPTLDQTAESARAKLHPGRYPNMSPRMAACLGAIMQQDWTTPQLIALRTVDGSVLGMAAGDVGFNHFIGATSDLRDNWSRLLDAAGLTPEERAFAEAEFEACLFVGALL